MRLQKSRNNVREVLLLMPCVNGEILNQSTELRTKFVLAKDVDTSVIISHLAVT